MDIHGFFIPPSVVYGAGAIDRLADEARGMGRKAILVSGRNALRSAGTLDAILDALRRRGGSVIDTSKAISAMVRNDGSVRSCE